MPLDNDDRVALKVQSSEFYIDLAPVGLITENAQTFIEHPYDEVSEGIDGVKTFPEDEVVAYTKLKFDLATTEYDVSIKTIRAGIRVKDNTGQSFDVDELTADGGSVVVNGLEFIDVTQPRVFKAPLTELIKNFTVERKLSSDSGDLRYYDVYFPFLVRWEYWEENINANTAFFDTAESNNGLNEEWFRFDNKANWNIYSFVEVVCTVNGEEQTYTFENQFYIQDYETGIYWSAPGILSFDEDDNALINGGDEFILGYADTKIQATFTWAGPGARPTTGQVAMVFRLNTFENGGIISSTRISSVYQVGSESQWKSTDGSNKIVLSTVSTDKIRGIAMIDYKKLNPFYKYTVTARIYDLRDLQS